jgi:hypothetical protein
VQNYKEYFEDNGYILLKEFLDPDSCAELTKELYNLIEQGFTKKDEQCPISEGIYGAVAFDSVLEQLLPKFEYITGRALLPTYSYARLYRPGERLKPHRDRPSCEVSATITIGFEGESWPIYFENESEGSIKINMTVGDAVVYKGEQLSHWRNRYTEGQWQAQIFLHYVTAEGPNENFKYDNRGCLSHYLKKEPPFYLLSTIDSFLTQEACDKLVASLDVKIPAEAARVGVSAENTYGIIDKRVRDVKNSSIPLRAGISSTVFGSTHLLNHEKWKFDISHQQQCDYLVYEKEGHFTSHIDTFLEEGISVRLLTTLLFLNDNYQGGRLFLKVGEEKYYPPQTKGTLLVFPSFILHGVEPVTSGTRKVIVSWAVGPWFK